MVELINEFFSDPVSVWAFAGVAFLIIEVAVIPAMGFLFAGLGALMLSGLIAYDIIGKDTTFYWQVSFFFAFTILWAVALWFPLKKWSDRTRGEYNDIIGNIAKVEGVGLKKGERGKIRWSGAQMSAMLATGCKRESIMAGENVYIVGKKGSVLYVSPTSIGMPDDATLRAWQKLDHFH